MDGGEQSPAAYLHTPIQFVFVVDHARKSRNSFRGKNESYTRGKLRQLRLQKLARVAGRIFRNFFGCAFGDDAPTLGIELRLCSAQNKNAPIWILPSLCISIDVHR